MNICMTMCTYIVHVKVIWVTYQIIVSSSFTLGVEVNVFFYRFPDQSVSPHISPLPYLYRLCFTKVIIVSNTYY
jgi:hypothetical protein